MRKRETSVAALENIIRISRERETEQQQQQQLALSLIGTPLSTHRATMPCLSCVSITTPNASVRASLADNHSLPSVPHVKVDPKPPSPRLSRATPAPPGGNKQKKTQKQQPTVIEIERAIGAGRFSDADPKELEQGKSVLGGVLPTDGWKVESSLERKLRETGEWIVDRSERHPASAGKSILMVAFLWVLPAWVLVLLVASGAVKLPFGVPFLDDLIM